MDPSVKGAMSEMFDKSQMSETIDVPAGCKRSESRALPESCCKLTLDVKP